MVRQHVQPEGGHTQGRTLLRQEPEFDSSGIREPGERRTPGKTSPRPGTRTGTSDSSSAIFNRAETTKRSRSVTTLPMRGKTLPLCRSAYRRAAIPSSGQVWVTGRNRYRDSPLRGGALLIALRVGKVSLAERSESRRAVRYDGSTHLFFDH